MRPAVPSPFVALVVLVAALPGCKGRFKLPPDARFVEQIALGDGFGCSRMKDGSVRCWGENDSGELGGALGPRTKPPSRSAALASPPPPISPPAESTPARSSAAARSAAGERSADWRAPAVHARRLAVGARHACALGDAGDVALLGGERRRAARPDRATRRSCAGPRPSPRGGTRRAPSPSIARSAAGGGCRAGGWSASRISRGSPTSARSR